MKRIANSIKVALLIALLPSFLMMGCKETIDTPEFELMVEYMIDNNMDTDMLLDGWITSASAVVDTTDYTIPGYYVIDIRAAADFATGHIDGAVNSSLGDILTEAQNATDPILVVCYSGQSASHAVTALRLSGYTDAKVLKWGMSGWHSDFDSWSSKTASIAVGDANWTKPAAIEASQTFDDPEVSTGMEEGEDILAEQVAAMLAAGFKGVAGADVLATPANYFINNFWAQADVDNYGHIAGAYRIQPLSLAGGEYNNLDPDADLVTYCWTGQTSSLMTSYLNVLGYNALSLKNGVNSLIHSELTGHKWDGAAIPDYDYKQ